MAQREAGVLGFHDAELYLFHKDDHTFSSLWTEFTNDFDRFHDLYEQDMERYRDVKGIFVKENPPPNTFPISMILGRFSGFNLNIANDKPYLLPIITGGKYAEQEGACCCRFHCRCTMRCVMVTMPACFSSFAKMADTCEDWLK